MVFKDVIMTGNLGRVNIRVFIIREETQLTVDIVRYVLYVCVYIYMYSCVSIR